MSAQEHTAENDAAYILEIQWDWDSTEIAISLPALVGPFDSRGEAEHWARLNIPNGSWECRPRPYARLIPPESGAS